MPVPTHPSATSLPSQSPAVIWGDFTLTDEDVARFRAALVVDCPTAYATTDDEVRQMAYDTIHFIALITGRASDAAATTH